jgi:hypothetical protein
MAGPGGAVHHWYKFAYEFAFVEVCMLLAIVPIGVVFDFLCHHAQHWVAQQTYSYGSGDIENVEDEESGRKPRGNQCNKHRQLFLVLLQRMGAEFMTLGFLALVIFVSEVQGLFQLLAESPDFTCLGDGAQKTYNSSTAPTPTPSRRLVPDGMECFHLPETSLDWFHTAEIVHFSLFFGMCFYFMLMLFFVRGAARKMRVWEEIRARDMRNQQSLRSLLMDTNARMPTLLGALPAEDQYRSMQEKFVDAVVRQQFSDEQFRGRLLRKLGAVHRADDDPCQLAEWLQAELRGPAFDFSAYLAFQLERAVSDNIEIHSFSWCMVWIYLAISWPLHRLAHMTIPQVVLIMLVAPTFLWLLGCLMLFRGQQGSIAKRRMDRIHSRHPARVYVPAQAQAATSGERVQWLFRGYRLLRVAQVICLICSYALARMVFSQPDWYSTHFNLTLVSTVVLMAIWVILMMWLQFHAPIFLALMSLPPYFNPGNNRAMANFWKSFTGNIDTCKRQQLADGTPCSTASSAAQVAPTDPDTYPNPADTSGRLSLWARSRAPEDSPVASRPSAVLEAI